MYPIGAFEMSTTRRDFIKDSVAFSSASLIAAQGAVGTARAQTGFRRIAVEEIYCPPEVIEATRQAVDADPSLEPGLGDNFRADNGRMVDILRRMQDVGEGRLRAMDEGRIDMAVLSNWSPGVQIFGVEDATELAAVSNERMAEAVRAHPDRYAALATIAPQDPEAAAQELERAVSTLGLSGVLINSHTHGEYLDDRKFWPIFEASEARNSPIYLHPRVPSPQMYPAMSRYNMHSAKWGFAMEVSTHVVRLISAGVFDQFPDLMLVLGHMGEGLPFWLSRLDTLANRGEVGNTISKQPSDYIRENVVITTSGMGWDPVLLFSHAVLGRESILFAVDYPYGDYAHDTAWMDAVDLPDEDKALIYSGNAERVFSLNI